MKRLLFLLIGMLVMCFAKAQTNDTISGLCIKVIALDTTYYFERASHTPQSYFVYGEIQGNTYDTVVFCRKRLVMTYETYGWCDLIEGQEYIVTLEKVKYNIDKEWLIDNYKRGLDQDYPLCWDHIFYFNTKGSYHIKRHELIKPKRKGINSKQ